MNLHHSIHKIHLELNPAECATLSATVTKIHTWLTEWSVDLHAFFKRDALLQSALIASSTAPWLSAEGAYLGAKFSCWVIALDDWIDDPEVGEPNIYPIIMQCQEALRRDADSSWHPLAVKLAEIRSDVFSRTRGTLLGSAWAKEVEGTITAMRFERKWMESHRGGNYLPSVAEYLHHGGGSSAVRPFLLILWSAMSTRAHSATMTDALMRASTVARLLNDLAGKGREEKEGAVNILTLGVRESEIASIVATEKRKIDNSLSLLISDGHPQAISLIRLIYYLDSIYRLQDLGVNLG
ncbi:terpene synthase family protein [Streptomyces sp. NPDC060085]|uniref:terpene synthase family protein n=1 Tax=Streptomyces sp. NPDC060085 TaxID=3347054 RepID=UPI00364F4D62